MAARKESVVADDCRDDRDESGVAVDWQELLREAASRFEVRALRPGQRELIELVLAGRDALGVMPTGSGKSLCYQLPALYLPRPVIVVSPLIALMQDQQEELAGRDIEAAKLNSTLTTVQERETVAGITRGAHQLVYVTPERVENPEYLDVLRQGGASLVVVDEAHCISQWGHDFRPAYLALRDAIRQLGRPPVLALTATATPEVIDDIVSQLGIDGAAVVNTGIERRNLFFEVFRTVNTAAKRERLQQLLEVQSGTGIIYVATIRAAEELAEWLSASGVAATRYHGKLPAREREDIQQRFMADEFRVIVATKAFGLGINKANIRFVAHYHFPDSLESYYQEAGRAGRDGLDARATLLYRLEDRRIQSYFLIGKYPRREESQHLYDVIVQRGRQTDGARGTSPSDLFSAASVTPRRGKVIVAQLESAGIVERRRRRLHVVKQFDSAAALEAFLGEYEQRHRNDRERLAAIMQYAQMAMCRVRYLREYFGDQPEEDCGHCDNCVSGMAARAVVPGRRPPERRLPGPPQPVAEPASGLTRPRFAPGDRVRHARFGQGEVEQIADQNVTVRFDRSGQKKVRAEFLRLLQSATEAMV